MPVTDATFPWRLYLFPFNVSYWVSNFSHSPTEIPTILTVISRNEIVLVRGPLAARCELVNQFIFIIVVRLVRQTAATIVGNAENKFLGGIEVVTWAWLCKRLELQLLAIGVCKTRRARNKDGEMNIFSKLICVAAVFLYWVHRNFDPHLVGSLD